MKQEFPSGWVIRLNELVRTIRRQRGWGDVQAIVQPPSHRDRSPVLRLELGASQELVPLSVRAVQHMMLTGQASPLIIEIKQAFGRIIKQEKRRMDRKARLGAQKKPQSFL